MTPLKIPDATHLLEEIRDGLRTSEEIVQAHLDQLDSDHHRLNAATEVFRQSALEEAKNPRPGKLSGLPITVKETFGLAGKSVTIGSKRMRPIECAEDAAVVKKLRDEGAIILARSNVPEFVMTGETDNLLYGRTNHPKDPNRTPGGSSGGEAALIASGASPLGFATDILGSIRIPSAFCGIVGFRPHSGAVDKAGIFPACGDFFETWNGVGPMARSVRDVRLAYDVIAKAPLPPAKKPEGLRMIAPEGFRLSYQSPCIKDAYMATRQNLIASGFKEEQPVFDDVPKLYLDIPRLVMGEMIPLWKDWLSSDGEKFRTVPEIIRQITGRPTLYPGFMKWLMLSPLLRPKSRRKLDRIIENYKAARIIYHDLLGYDGVLILPTVGLLAPKHGQMNRISLKPGVNGLFTAETFANVMNLSAITVPAPLYADPTTCLAPGIMLACAPGAEANLLDAAALVETGLSTNENTMTA